MVPREVGLVQQRQADEIIADIERRHAAAMGEPAYAQLRHGLMKITEICGPDDWI